jgi:hypothetical protein
MTLKRGYIHPESIILFPIYVRMKNYNYLGQDHFLLQGLIYVFICRTYKNKVQHGKHFLRAALLLNYICLVRHGAVIQRSFLKCSDPGKAASII